MKTLPFTSVAVCGLLCLFTLTACQFPGQRKFNPRLPPVVAATNLPAAIALTSQLDSQLLRPSATPFTLGPGDVVEVEMLDDIASRALLTVGPDGKIYFNLLPGLDVWGLTLDQARDQLEQELAKYMRERPRVSLTVRAVESKKLWMLGRFTAPGVYSMTNSMTLLEAIFSAGGPLNVSNSRAFARDFASYNANDDLADLGHAFVLRQGKLVPVDFQRLFAGDLSQNIYLQPDDFVYLPPMSAEQIHVMGEVATPRAVPYTRRMTLTMAIAQAGGTGPDAFLYQVAIVRGSLTRPEIALVNFRDIVRGRTNDVFLAAGDLIYVPIKPYQIINRYWDVITTTFVSSVAINEGARAVIKSAAPTQGILIPFGSSITINPAK